MSPLFAPDLATPVPIDACGTWPATTHQFDEESVWAVRAAILAGRPLLLRGEPGIGKSQLARAAAQVLKVPFLCHVVDERTERDDLLFSFDAVARLAEAQLAGRPRGASKAGVRNRLRESRFFRPGVLWWAIDWRSALEQAREFSLACRPCGEPARPPEWQPNPKDACGPVVLVDEIDKADPSVPNGLLECLGNQGFFSAQLGRSVQLPEAVKPPLILVTTNEERELPSAFLRRCLVLEMKFPSDRAPAIAFLKKRARVHVAAADVGDAALLRMAEILLADRDAIPLGSPARPGAAEFLDMARILQRHCPGDEARQLEVLPRISGLAFRKNLSEVR